LHPWRHRPLPRSRIRRKRYFLLNYTFPHQPPRLNANSHPGFHVLATVRDPTKYTSPHPNITYLPLELTSDASIAALHKHVTSLLSPSAHLAILYNNAGRNYTVPALDISASEVHATFEANLYSIMALCQAFAPQLIASKGTIAMTGSLAGIMPYVFGSVYNASKAALHAYADTLRVELAPLGVRVVTVVTGGVKSNIARTHRTLPEGSYYEPLADVYEGRLTHSQSLGMDTQSYARSCVRQVTEGDGWWGWFGLRRSWIWEGKMSWVVWFVWFCLPRCVLDWYMVLTFKLGRLAGTAENKKTD
jgi:1-acylglycerone phosphate reductase